MGSQARLCRALGNVRYALIQAPMAGVQDSRLAIAVTRAGGLGSLPCAMLSPAALESELQAVARSCDAEPGAHLPLNVNFFCHDQPDAGQPAVIQAVQRWEGALRPYRQAYGVAPSSSAPPAPSRAPFNSSHADVLEAFRPRVVSFHFGLPSAELLDRVRGWGATVLASATSVAEAAWLEAQGVDAVIAQGSEAGGHRATFLHSSTEWPDGSCHVGTLALVRQVVAAVSCPVVAAGGIADAAGAAAACAMGAAGVQVGTAYMLCPEATTPPAHAAKLVLAAEAARGATDGAQHRLSTAITNVFTGRPARGFVTPFVAEMGPMNSIVAPFPLAAQSLAALRAAAEETGVDDFSAMWCGQNASACRAVPAAEITAEVAQGLPHSTYA